MVAFYSKNEWKKYYSGPNLWSIFCNEKTKKKQVTKNVAYYIVSSLINNIQSVSIVVGKSKIWDKRNKISP